MTANASKLEQFRKAATEKKTFTDRATTFRVIRLTEGQREVIKQGRTNASQTNEAFLASTIEAKLPKLVEQLAALGFAAKAKTRPARLPFSDDTLAALRDASDETGIPAVQLLCLCLGSAAPTKTRKAKPTAKARKSKKGGR